MFIRVRELACTGGLESWDGESLAAGKVHAGQDLSEVPDKERYPRPPGWGLGLGITSSLCKN
jgi:hypothetical protein